VATEKLKKVLPKKRDKNAQPNGGKRLGSGRKKGFFGEEKTAALEAKKQFQLRVAKNVGRLFNAQFNKAVGESYLMWEHNIGTRKTPRLIVEIVKDPEIIKQYLDGSLESEGYYYITTKPADNSAITNMLDRGLGKATDHIEADITSQGERITGLSESQFAQLARARAGRVSP